MLRNVLSLFQMTSSVFFKMFDKIKLARYFCKTKWGSRKGRTNLSCLFSSSKRNTSRIYWSLPAKEACRAILIENLLLWFCFFIFAKVLFHLLKRPWMINFSAAIYPNWLPRLKERVTNIFTSNITWFISSTLWRDKLWTNHTILSPQDHTCLHATLRLCVVKSKFSLSKLYKNNLCLDELKKSAKTSKGSMTED